MVKSTLKNSLTFFLLITFSLFVLSTHSMAIGQSIGKNDNAQETSSEQSEESINRLIIFIGSIATIGCLIYAITLFIPNGEPVALEPSEIGDYVKAIELNPEYDDSYISLEKIYSTHQQYEQAKIDYTKAIGINPKDTIAYFNRGIIFDKQGKYDEAIRDFTKVIDLNAGYADAYLYRGNDFYKLGQYDKAIYDYIEVVAVNPEFAGSYFNRGNAYYQLREYEQASRFYTNAIKINSEYAEAYLNRGAAYDELGQYEQAISDYTKAIEINPNYAEAYNNRGYAYFVKLDDNVKACADWKKACEMDDCYNYNIAKENGDCQ